MLKTGVLWGLALLAFGMGGLAVNWGLATPSHDRVWQPLYDRLPLVTEAGGTYEIANLRNWTYGPDRQTTQDWLTVQIDPKTLKRVYFIEEPFGDMRAIAHTMLAFEFEDGSGYVASVEARREVGETYGGLTAGVLPMHEYLVVWTTERDMYGNSTYYTGDDLYAFPLDLPKPVAEAVLIGMLDLTQEVAAEPRWYNTFFSNCTNVLARAVNRVATAPVPWDIAWYLPGYAAEFLYDQGLVAGEGSFEEVRAASFLTPRITPAYDITDPVAFSRALRE